MLTVRPGAVLAVWWLTCVLWSSVWLFVKIGVTDIPPLSFAGLRLAIALVLLTPVAWRHRRLFVLTRRELLVIGSTGLLLLGVNYALVFWGAQFIASGTTATLQAATPAFGLIIGSLTGRARATARQFAGVALGIAGVAAVSADQLSISGPNAVLGSIAVAGGAACVALAYTVVKEQLRNVAPIVILVGQMMAGCAALLVFGAIFEGSPAAFHWTRRGVIALVYLAIVGSIAGFWLNLWLLKRTTTAALLSMSIVEPLLAVALGAAVLSERLHPLTAAGAALILVSVRLVVLRPQTSAASAQP